MAKAISKNPYHDREIRFCADPELRSFLNKECQAEGINRSELIRRYLLDSISTRGHAVPEKWKKGHVK